MRDQVADWLAAIVLLLFLGTVAFGCHAIVY
jgi:hypothetical protein